MCKPQHVCSREFATCAMRISYCDVVFFPWSFIPQ
uniref:Uncharacterized protein n=1 Tax=Arundo donax TaxID=35708 RepID=A0A0A9G1W9_ARUDO